MEELHLLCWLSALEAFGLREAWKAAMACLRKPRSRQEQMSRSIKQLMTNQLVSSLLSQSISKSDSQSNFKDEGI